MEDKNHEGQPERRRIDPEQIIKMALAEIAKEPEPKEPEEEIPEFTPFPEDIFDDLPPLLRTATEHFDTQKEREMFLVGAIGVLSGMMPNVWGVYFRKRLAPNLYCYVMGRYGTGKGSLVFARELGESTDNYRTQLSEQAVKAFDEETLNYNRQVRLYDKGKLQEPPTPPKPPRHLKLYIPANSSKTAMMQLLKENDGSGIIFETEGDTLSDMLKQEYGNFSDVLRKAFHHEPVSYFRRANNEDVKISKPCLSVVLSGTEDQLYRLVPSIENGLFSRFMFYVADGYEPFRNPFEDGADDFEQHFIAMSERYCRLYKLLSSFDEPVYFKLQKYQVEKFTEHFAKVKEELHEAIGADLDGTTNRMAVIAFRIAMVLSVIRLPDLKAGDTLSCTPADFDNALAISDSMMQYMLYTYQLLQKSRNEPEIEVEDKKKKIEDVCRCHSMNMSVREIAKDLFGSEKKRGMVYDWINKYCKKAG